MIMGTNLRTEENDNLVSDNWTCIEVDKKCVGKEIFQCNYCKIMFDGVVKTKKIHELQAIFTDHNKINLRFFTK